MLELTFKRSDPRGFAVKFRTAEGNWDFVANNTPVFFRGLHPYT